MESDKIRLMLHKDKLFHEYQNTTVGSFYVTYKDYLKERGLSHFRNVPIPQDIPSGVTIYVNEYTIIDHKQFFLTKIKYGI